VLLHALCDALLGALALGDIGSHFPDTDPAYKGADSRKLLAAVVDLIHGKGWKVGNVDCTVVLERPKLRPHIDGMRTVIAELLGVALDAVSVKATTNEKMGFAGREEGVCAYAVALLERE
jgi:2-C-methyl-D-erythritol 2,4-cyclodiphosphate synthase